MRPALIPFAIIMAALLVASPATAQLAQKMSLSLVSVKSDDSVLDDRGRLEAGVPYKTRYSFMVSLPPTTGVCPFGTVTVTFQLVAKPTYATAIVSPSTITQAVPLPSPLGTTEIRGYDTEMTVVLADKAPKGDSGLYQVRAVATPSSTTIGGCNIAQSDPLVVSKVIVAA